MHVKYRCPVKGHIRIPIHFGIPTDFIRYEFEVNELDQLTHISAIIPVPDKSMWPTVRTSNDAGVSLAINITSPFFEVARRDLRAAEGMLALFGIESIDTENVEESWLPDSPEEKRELELYSFTRGKAHRPVSEWPFTPFDLIARASICASRRDIETALSFFRKGRADVIEVHRGSLTLHDRVLCEKFKSTQVEHEYLASDELQSIIKAAVQDDVLKRNIAGDERIKRAYLHDYHGKTPSQITKHMVDLRGFLHHHSKNRKDIWHPDDHVRFGADAYFLQQLCFAVGFRLLEPVMFAPEFVKKYQELAQQDASSKAVASKEGGHNEGT